MHFYQIKNPTNFKHCISGTKTELLSKFKDLGIHFDPKLHFSVHTEMIKNKVFRNLGYINHTCGLFRDPIPLKIL